jgi:hypothetical protein
MRIKTLLLSGILFCGLGSLSAQTKMAYSVSKAGTLISQLTREGADSIVELKLTGKINAVDFRHLRDEFKNLKVLDLSGADIRTYIGRDGTDQGNLGIYKADYIPKLAFLAKKNLQTVVLPYSVKCIDDEAFRDCPNLRILQLNNQTAPRLGKDALSDTITTVFIPASASDNYRRALPWDNFSLIESEPVALKVQIAKLGSLQEEILKAGLQPSKINFLTVEGKMDEDDFMVIRNYMANLASIDLTNTTAETIPDFTFSQKKHLIHIDFPKNLHKIGQRAFSGCNKLGGTLILPPTLTAIEYGAFIDCDHLTHLRATSNKLTAVGDNLFGKENSKLIYKR